MQDYMRYHGSVTECNEALLAQMSGEDVELPEGHGWVFLVWNLTQWSLAAPLRASRVVVEADCELCDQVLAAVRRCSDLPLRQVDLASEEAGDLEVDTAPTVFLFDIQHRVLRGPVDRPAVLDDLDGFIEQVCLALAHAPASCRS